MSNEVDTGRRNLVLGTAVVGGAGAVMGVWPLLASMVPSARARAAGAPVEVDVSKLEPGQMATVEWRGKPVWIVHRTEEALAAMATLDDQLVDPTSEMPQQPEYTKNATRSIKEKFAVLVGVCTHLGCSPTYRPEVAPEDLGAEWKGGFFCPCHGSKFDLAGRVYKGVPAPKNLAVPPYTYLSDTQIMVGVDQGAA